MARWIGIDYGGVRSGLAFTDANAVIAFPHKTVMTKELLQEISMLLAQEPCRGIVLGMPNGWAQTADEGHTDSTQGILDFSKELNKKWPELEIQFADESHTSMEALSASIQAGMKKSKRSRKGALDAIAATLILQRFLEQE